jgi:chromosome segregation ATPase
MKMKEVNMADKSLYNAVAQRYYNLMSDKHNLLEDRIRIEARLHMIDEEMIALNDILCKHGKHLYEHFVGEDKGE